MSGKGGPNDHAEFIKVNANVEFIAAQFAEVFRHLMRAVSSDDPSVGVYHAAQSMNFVAELLSKTEENFSFHQLFLKVVEESNSDTEWRSAQYLTVHAARRGMKYLVERSCSDNAARGRARKRECEFLSAIKAIDEEREARGRRTRNDL